MVSVSRSRAVAVGGQEGGKSHIITVAGLLLQVRGLFSAVMAESR